jgi:hypothetical protein
MAGIAEAAGLEEVEALTDMDLPNVETPIYDPMTIDTPNGPFTITPVDVDPPNIDDYINDVDSRLGDLEDLVNEFTGIDYAPDTDTYYDSNGDPLPTGKVADDPDSFVGNKTPIDDAITGEEKPIASPFDDGWIHQIDGVTYATGTINFVTTKPSGDGDSGSNKDDSEKPPTTPKKSTWEKNALDSAKRLAKQIEENKKKKEQKKTPAKQKKKENFKVTAANIAGSMGIYIGDPTGHGDKPTYNELFGKSNDDAGFTSVDDWLNGLFGGGGGHKF